MRRNAKISVRLPRDVAWKKGFAALKQLKSRENHYRVARGHQEGNVELDTWL
jgi:hypothetical protein